MRPRIKSIALSFFAISILGIYFPLSQQLQKNKSALTQIQNIFLPLSREIGELETSVQTIRDSASRVSQVANPDNSVLEQMRLSAYSSVVRDRLGSMESRLKNQKDIPVLREEMLNRQLAVQELFTKLLESKDSHSVAFHGSRLHAQLSQFAKLVDAQIAGLTEKVEGGTRNALVAAMLGAMISLGIGILMLIIADRTLKPLARLVEGLRRSTEGQLVQSIKISSNGHEGMAALVREFNRMLTALKERDGKIQLQQTEILKKERLAAVGELSAQIVHEIRNPLNAISLNIDWLREELDGHDAEIQKTLTSVSREIERLFEITESYLSRAKLNSNSQRTTPVHELIHEILDFSAEENRRGAIEVSCEFSDQEIFVHADKNRLRQAFLNIVKNAKEAMPMGGSLSIKTETAKNISKIIFSDSGSGMNDVTRRKSFDPFYSTKLDGTGLGLAMTKTIIEEAHGNVSCDSQLGKGTVFTVQFPV